jgi:hypothetical protein
MISFDFTGLGLRGGEGVDQSFLSSGLAARYRLVPSLARVVHPSTLSSRAHSSSASSGELELSCEDRFGESELEDGIEGAVEERALGARRALAACGGRTESFALRERGASEGARGR